MGIIFCINNEISFTIISLSSSDKFFLESGFLLGIAIMLQIITGIFLALHYTSDLNSAYFSLFFLIREVYYGWCLRYLHSSTASFVFLFLFLHVVRAMFYGSYFYNPKTWFSGILLFNHMYTVGLETDTRAYFTGVTIFISLPTGTKIFNWLSSYFGNPPLLHLKTSSALFALLFLLMFTIGGSTGVILGNAAVDLGLP